MEEKKKAKFYFEFEQLNWHKDKKSIKFDMSKNGKNKIEEERKNIEKDLKILSLIRDERTRQKNMIIALLKTKEVLEKKINAPANK